MVGKLFSILEGKSSGGFKHTELLDRTVGKLGYNSSGRGPVRILGLVSLILLFASVSFGVLNVAYAHEGEEAAWLPVHQVEGNLELSLDASASQWGLSHHGHADGLDAVEMDLMSVHNGTYFVLLVQRSFNTSLSNAGVSLFLNGTLFDTSNAIWGWVGGQNNSTDLDVKSAGVLTGGELTVVFGRPLVPASGFEARLSIGVAYDDAIKVTSWNNGTAASTLNYDGVESMGLELLPHLDIFPRPPFVYATVLLAGALVFIFLEFRRYRA